MPTFVLLFMSTFRIRLTGRIAEYLEKLRHSREDLFSPDNCVLTAQVISWEDPFRVSISSAKLAYRIMYHIESRWPDCTDYNAWYAISKARDAGLLDENYEPANGRPPASRMEELFALGGAAAVSSYNRVFEERS